MVWKLSRRSAIRPSSSGGRSLLYKAGIREAELVDIRSITR